MLIYSETLHAGNKHKAVQPKKLLTVLSACDLISINTFSTVYKFRRNMTQTAVMMTPDSSFHAYYGHSALCFPRLVVRSQGSTCSPLLSSGRAPLQRTSVSFYQSCNTGISALQSVILLVTAPVV